MGSSSRTLVTYVAHVSVYNGVDEKLSLVSPCVSVDGSDCTASHHCQSCSEKTAIECTLPQASP